MTRFTFGGVVASGALLLALSGCGGAATPLPPGSAVAAAPSQAAPSVAAPSTAPSAAEPSAEPSAAEPSFAVPSFALPSEAKDLEALLPDTLCGKKTIKTSLSGASFAATADDSFKATLAALGKQPSDVTLAFAFSEGDCGAGIFRISGVDQNALKQALLAEEQKSGNTYTESSVGGKDVFVGVSGSSKQYVYFTGDAVIFAQAKDEASAATILQQLPGG